MLAGYSTGNWSGTTSGSSDFPAVGLHSDANMQCLWQVILDLRMRYSRSSLLAGLLSDTQEIKTSTRLYAQKKADCNTIIWNEVALDHESHEHCGVFIC